MIIVIQCSGRKFKDAGTFKNEEGKPVYFVANPDCSPSSHDIHYARPDDVAYDGKTWREKLSEYNENPKDNPFGLKPACELYANACYQTLTSKIGEEKLFILSAGWGLINAGFLTPDYNITFSSGIESYKRRRKTHQFNDFQQLLPLNSEEPILFFGSKSYLPLFDSLTKNLKNPRRVFYRVPEMKDNYNHKNSPAIYSAQAIAFPTRRMTNWHYECVQAFLDDKLDAEISS